VGRGWLSRKERLRAIRARLAELLEDGTLPLHAREHPSPCPGHVGLHVGTLLHLAHRLEAWPGEQKRTAQYREAAAFVAGELERLDSWLSCRRAARPRDAG